MKSPNKLRRADITKIWHRFCDGELNADEVTKELRALTLDQLWFDFTPTKFNMVYPINLTIKRADQ